MFGAGQLIWLNGAVDVLGFAAAIEAVFLETDTLRARFEDDDGVPFQCVDRSKVLLTRILDSEHDDAQVRAMARQQLIEMPKVSADPSTCSTLVRRTGGSWAWLLTTNVLLIDGYGLSLFNRRVAEVYGATQAGGVVPDRWFGSLKDGVDATSAAPDLDTSLGYWERVLGIESVERQDSAESLSEVFAFSYQPSTVPIRDETYAQLQELARNLKVSWTDLLIAAWGVYTASTRGQEYVAVRVPMMLRDSRDLLRTPSAVSRAVPVVVKVRPYSTFMGAVEAVSGQLKTSRRHMAVEDHQIARMWPGGQASYLALPTVNIRLFDSIQRLGDIVAVPETISPGPVGSVDLAVYRDSESGIRMEVSARAAVRDSLLHASQFGRFLDGAIYGAPARTLYELHAEPTPTVDLPEARVAGFRLPPAEDHRTVTAWAHGSRVPIPDITLDDLVRGRVARTPAAVAVVDDADGAELTCASLDARVNSLARLLIDGGVGIGARVGVLLPRCADLVVTLAAVIRAGAAYVPIDPEYPVERVGRIVESAAPTLVVTDTATTASLGSALGDVVLVRLDDATVSEALRRGEADAPVLSRSLVPQDEAAVIFTSGTTGRPKGVVVSHGAIVNRLTWGNRRLGLDETSVVLAKSGVGFVDASTELLGPLVAGGTVRVLPDPAAKDPRALREAIREHRVTHLLTVPTLGEAITDQVGQSDLASLRHWVCSGERLAPAVRDKLRGAAPAAVLHDFYGSTEITGDATAGEVGKGSTSIGNPVANTTTHVLDTWLHPVAPGVVGELYVGGVQLAYGYLGQTALTAERFVAHPFGSDGERLYRTGDLVRWNQDGQLEYLGRSDDQIKIRGFRIEPDEIRNILMTHEAVSGAVVVAVDHPAGGKFLAAYVTTNADTDAGDGPVVAEALHKYAATILPEYMVPTTVTVLETLPVTANGKLDWRVLRVPDLGAVTAGGRAPETKTEQTLAGAFHGVLQLGDDVSLSVDDDFFRLGGHSLLATRVVARVNGVLGSALTLRDVFDHPTIAGLATIVDASREGEVGPASMLRVGDLQRPDVLPVSFGQQSLWLIEQLGGPGGRYVVPVVRRLSGDLDGQALGQAVRDVVARHEALRTLILEENGQLQQVVVPAREATTDLRLAVEDFAGLGEAAIDARITELVRQGFDLAADIPVRAGLLQVDGAEWVLVLAVHHHAVDEWSLPSVLGDLSTAYQARVAGEEPGWAPLPMQYADYALWQRETLGDPGDADSEISRLLRYWQEVLEDAPEESTISLDRARPAEPTYRGEDVEFTIAPGTVGGLRKVADQLGVTTFVIAQAATALAVSVLSGADDMVIGSPVGGRIADGVEDLVGYFVNTLPIRHQLNPSDTLADFLQRTRDTVLDGFAHQAAPFEEIARAVGVDRSTNRNPIFQIMLTHRIRQEEAPLRFGEATATPRSAPLGAAKTDLDLYFTDTPAGITGFLTYATDVLNFATVGRFVSVLQAVLDAICTNTERRIGDLAVLPDRDKQLTNMWSNGEILKVPELTLDALIRDQATASPGAVAVVDDANGAELTYAAFDQRVNALAQLLVDRGVQVGARVGVLLPRSSDLVVTLAAVIRAGGAYVPIDPEYPIERVRNILEAAAPTLVVTDTTTAAAHAQGLSDAALIHLDDSAVVKSLDLGHSDPPVLSRPLLPGDAAYLIFTSGTTGRPKGVSVPHRAIVNRLAWGRKTLGVGSSARVVLKTPDTFDVSVPEFFTPLIVGATIIVARDGAHKDPEHLARVIRNRAITIVHFVPSMLQAFLDAGHKLESFPHVRAVSFSGEALPAVAAATAGRLFDSAELFNLYGPTEAAVEVTAQHLTDLERFAGNVPIGSPVPNSFVRVLDTWLRPLPPGVTGELYLGGVQLADGYVGRYSLTAERFVADPSGEAGERLYRTGDLVRWNDRGELEYLGRSDDQVKIRGFRIEPDEIRSVLETHEFVSGAVVVALDHRAGGKFLAAYITTTDEAPGDDSAIGDLMRQHAAGSLPAYMVPATVTVLDAFPVTGNGKLDRGALPAPNLGATAGGGAPETETEKTLAAVFADVLRLPKDVTLSVDDDFFRLGGDSILSIQAARKAGEQGITLRVQDVFKLRTVGALAASVYAARTPATPTAAVTLPPSPTLSSLRESGDDTNAWVLTESVMLPVDAVSGRVERAFLNIIAAIDSLRLRVDPANRRLWLQEVLPPGAGNAPAQWVDARHGLSVPELRELAVERLDVLAGLPAAAAASESDDGLLIVVAVHAAAADRRSVHELVTALVADGPLPRFDSVAAQLEAVDAAGAALDPSTSDRWLMGLDVPLDEGALDGDGFAVFELESGLTESAVRDAAARAAAAATAAPGTPHPAVAVEVDLRDVGAEGESGAQVLGAFTASSPRSHGEPLADGVDPAEFPLLRYHNRVGRRALRKATDPAVLVTQQYGTLSDPRVREGVERTHRVVVRYHLADDATHVTVLGLNTEAARAFERRVRAETAGTSTAVGE